MYNIHTETPSGAVSRGYDYETEEKALTMFTRVEAQLEAMGFVGDLILTEGGVVTRRESISNVHV
jgi:hypothetical protein